MGCYFSSVEDLNNKKAAIIPKTAMGRKSCNTIPAQNVKNKKQTKESKHMDSLFF
jgi:hypothetical protein